jgi:hypothetical protein
MQRRTSSLPCRVYSYGCRPPTQSQELVDQQFKLARVYKNKLTEIEIHRRHRYREITGEHERMAPIVAAIEQAEAELETTRAAISAARADARRRLELKEASARAKALSAQLRELRAKRKELRGEIAKDPAIQTALAALELSVRDQIKHERSVCGVYWGSYLLIEEAASQAQKSRTDPRFRRWDGSGRIGVQIQGGASTEDIMHSRCSQLQIDALDASTWLTRSGRRAARTTARIRIGSDATRSPIWAAFPLILHRPLPADAKVKGAWIKRDRRGPGYEYQLQVVLEAESCGRSYGSEARPMAALNLGWRVRPEGIRVGYLVDELGGKREFLLPLDDDSVAPHELPQDKRKRKMRVLGRLAYADGLRATRDKNLDAFKAKLLEGLKALPGPLPEWLSNDLQTMHAWRSADRFSRWVLAWSKERFEGDGELFAMAFAWRKQELHLWEWESHQRTGANRHRREIYRLWARELARDYSLVVLEEFDLRQVARRAKPEQDEESTNTQRKNRMRVAPSLLRSAIIEVCKVGVIDPMNNTHICHACGSVEQFDAIVHLSHDCGACGVRWDQDFNAAQNALRRWRERPPSGPDDGETQIADAAEE